MIATRCLRCVPGRSGDVLLAGQHFSSRKSVASLCRSRSGVHVHCARTARDGRLLVSAAFASSSARQPTRAALSGSSPCIGSSLQRRTLSQIPRGGADLLGPEALAVGENTGGLRKIVLDSYMPTGFDVMGMLDHAKEFDDDNDESLKKSPTLHMNGSMIAFPTSCFLWDVTGPKDVTLESLSLILLREPSVEFLFIGCNHPLPPRELNKIRRELKERGVVVEQLDLVREEEKYKASTAAWDLAFLLYVVCLLWYYVVFRCIKKMSYPCFSLDTDN